mmetsp:Transcript_17236/g.16568  ORF Transcript_17236/g.16568 Transcript_17236/m.16568 type:complete len:471 (-) Transcript_17236:106-1518(-)
MSKMKLSFVKVINRFMTTTIRRHQKCPSFNPNNSSIFKNKTIYHLISRAVLFKLLGNQALVNFSSFILQGKYSAYNGILKPFIKKTIFKIFCSGVNISECLSFADKLTKEENITSIVDHSCEELEGEVGFQSNMLEKVNLLTKIGGDNSSVNHVPLKCTSLIDSGLLERLTIMLNNESLIVEENKIEEDMKDFRFLLMKEDRIKFEAGIRRFKKICEIALANHICILLDAEQSNRQPAVEIIAQILSEKYNLTNPVVFNTYQTYLKRTPKVLKRDMNRAKTGNYIFAAKIVRGAYILSERKAAMNSIHGHEDPVLPSRVDTDLAYNLAVESILKSISPLNINRSITKNSKEHFREHSTGHSKEHSKEPAVMIATHNRESIQLAVDTMLKLGIPNDHPNVQFAQIQGMSDHITLALSLSGYNVSKLLLFGSFEDLLPWLLRRLEENKDIFGAMQSERQVYHKEIFRRLNIF